MKFGYIRVSKNEQNYDLQIDALKREGCERIFSEKVSGAAKHRPEYERMKQMLRSGDEVVVWDIDRLGRTTLDLISQVDEWKEQGIRFKSTSQPLIDTSTEHGEFVFGLFALLAEHERKRLRRRTLAGLQAARERGRVGGRPKGLSERYMKIAGRVLKAQDDGATFNEMREAFMIPSNATVYKILDYAREQLRKQVEETTPGTTSCVVD